MFSEQTAHLCVLIKQLHDVCSTQVNGVMRHATSLLLAKWILTGRLTARQASGEAFSP